MSVLTKEQIEKFEAYVSDSESASDNLAFVFNHVGTKLDLDFSRDSLVDLEKCFWELRENIPTSVSDTDHVCLLMGQYLGQCVIRATGAQWKQCSDNNGLKGQPCLDGFGNKKWDRLYPVSLSLNFEELPRQKPNFPGVREKTVLASQFDKALKLHSAAEAS